ncbi:MAG: hypothetical protein QOF08_2851 [Gaiellales bacterium]|jgi:hypothetical protein|nr:hypothetical protein [Gaiellales bacterium]
MDARPFAFAAVTAALAIPAVVLADGLGPHSSWYDQHPKATKPMNNVSIVVHRDKNKADVFVDNFCLGSESPSGSPKYPDGAGARGLRVSKGKISYSGKATIYRQSGQEQVAMRFAATVKPKSAAGSAKFPGKPCGTIGFTAKLAGRTK